MSVKIICDICGEVIGDTNPITIFRMWNLPIVSEVTAVGLSHFAHDEDYYLCVRCFNALMECVEEMKRP